MASPKVIDLSTPEEKRQRMVDRRWQHLCGDTGLVEKAKKSGDPLIELHTIAVLLAGPNLALAQVVARFVASVKLGSFPVPGTGFHYYGRDWRVRDLFDLYNYNQFAAGQYPLHPSPLTVEMTASAMRARRSVWRRWIEALGWPVPLELQSTPEEWQLRYNALLTPAYVPTIEDGYQWGRTVGLSEREVDRLRADNPDPRLHVSGPKPRK
jgi:hypothetical protein